MPALSEDWRHLRGRFHCFIESLCATDDDHRRAWSAAGHVARALRGEYRPLDTLLALHPPEDSFDHRVIGSHQKGTATRGTDAVDVVYVLPDGERRRMWRVGGPRRLHAEIGALLRARFVRVRASPVGWFAVRIDSPGERPMAVRLIPGFAEARDSGGPTFATVAPDSLGPWRRLDPDAEQAALRATDSASGRKATHLVLMLKAWRRAQGIRLPSPAIERLVCEFVSVWIYQRRSLLFYDWMIRDFFFWLQFQGGRRLPLPGGAAIDLGDAWTARVEAAHLHAKEACALERDNQDADAALRWSRIFGAGFLRLPPPSAAPAAAIDAPAVAERGSAGAVH